jgi:hypothetical protein
MELRMKKLACLLVLAGSGCPDVKVDNDEISGPVVEFDPARSVATGARFLPFPNDLVRDPTTGKLNLSAQACESATSKATREGILNKLDGFGTYEAALVVTFTSEVDMASLEGNVVLYQITNQGTAIDPGAAVSVPLILRKTQSVRLLPDACTTPSLVNAVVAVPMVPLTQKSTYVAAILKGVKDTTGAEFTGSYTWGLVNASEAPVTLDAAGNVVSERRPRAARAAAVARPSLEGACEGARLPRCSSERATAHGQPRRVPVHDADGERSTRSVRDRQSGFEALGPGLLRRPFDIDHGGQIRAALRHLQRKRSADHHGCREGAVLLEARARRLRSAGRGLRSW